MNTNPKSSSRLTRREFGKLALAAAPVAPWLLKPSALLAADPPKPNSVFGGVQVGIIAPYSFRGLGNDPGELLKAIVKLGLSSVELQSQAIEPWAGAPAGGFGGFGGGRGGRGERGQRGERGERGREGQPAQANPNAPPAQQGGENPGRGRGGQPDFGNPERLEAMRARTEELRKWRLSVSMEKFKELRKMYQDAGVAIGLVKFGLGNSMTDEEVGYCFEVAKALGARGITCEPPVSETERLGKLAEKHQMMIGYHGHSNVTSPEAFGRPDAWERAFAHSKWNRANIDIGHFAAGNGVTAAEFIKRYHERITNIHLKDRKFNQGENMPWGQGDSQVKEILQLMKREKYSFVATIELEYRTPEGSDTMTELAKCVQFCREALS